MSDDAKRERDRIIDIIRDKERVVRALIELEPLQGAHLWFFILTASDIIKEIEAGS